MAAFEPGAGEVGDLILPVAQGLQPVHRPQVDVRLKIGVKVFLPVAGGEGGARLDLQKVGRDVLYPGIGAELDGTFHIFRRLLWNTQHQIQGDILEPGAEGVLHRGPGIFRRVAAAQDFQLGGDGRLEAEGNPVEPRCLQLPQGALQGGVGVGFQGDLAPGAEAVLG